MVSFHNIPDMRKGFFIVLSALTFSWLILFSGCNSKNATTGTLTIQIVDYVTNAPVSNELVYLATSYKNLKNHVWINSLYTRCQWESILS